MPNPSVSMDQELLDEFDEKIKRLKLQEEIDIDTSRSQVMQELVRQWVEGNSTLTSSDSRTTAKAD